MSSAFIFIFLGLIVFGVPIVFAMVAGPMAIVLLDGNTAALRILMQRMFAGVDKFPVVAIPLFLLAGEIMNSGAITHRLVNFANALIGHVRGGLAYVNIVSSVFFSGISGSAIADTSALGSILVPAMERDGYTRSFAAAVTAASSIIGPIIPPSILMVIYAYVMELSVGALFAAGILPGLVMAAGMVGMTAIIGRRQDFPKRAKAASVPELWSAFREAFLPLLTPVIILGGIISGYFTATEAAAIAVIYALVLTLFVMRTLKPSDLWGIFSNAGLASASILLMVGAAMAFGWAASVSQVADKVADLFLGITSDKLLLLLLVNVMLLLIGTVLDATPAILILGPILEPAMTAAGVDPLHFAIIMCVNVTIGLTTPPIGIVLFVASSVSGVRVEKIAREILPYLAVQIVVILLLTYVPALSLTVPRLLGLH